LVLIPASTARLPSSAYSKAVRASSTPFHQRAEAALIGYFRHQSSHVGEAAAGSVAGIGAGDGGRDTRGGRSMKHRHASEKNRKLEEDAHLLRAWRNWHREQLEEACSGPHRMLLEALLARLKNIQMNSAAELLRFFHQEDWKTIDANTKFVVLHELNSAIVRLRECNGLDGISDPLPGQQENLFRAVKALLA
jgi:hypothetical protein